MDVSSNDTDRLAGLLDACGDYTGTKNGPSSEKLPTGANIPQLMARLNLAESSLAQTLAAFMEHATAAYNFLAILYHLLDEVLGLLRSAADSVQLGPEGVPFRALHVSILDRFKSFRDRCRLLRNSLPDIDATFGSGQAALAAELKAVGFHYISRILSLVDWALMRPS
ncbi:hypothetical protein ARMSODRAFT_602142 [Armillaria solidipes]|uniref:Uncharacterized protein n=1 Tax=Armillaria solidipes TaxID=1076256 RepID=A0A2H3BI34_9AGAR|nr:hypothetical protein ARMSODRAFT_602142 [Armillaria solidipes]